MISIISVENKEMSSLKCAQCCPLEAQCCPLGAQCCPLEAQCCPLEAQCCPLEAQCCPLEAQCCPLGLSAALWRLSAALWRLSAALWRLSAALWRLCFSFCHFLLVSSWGRVRAVKHRDKPHYVKDRPEPPQIQHSRSKTAPSAVWKLM
uniref:Granulins domain-containing protein n=1 Tax=Neogobius melanostomus TaxID=47308 RepID=A0A8C6WQV9_9GOBI